MARVTEIEANKKAEMGELLAAAKSIIDRAIHEHRPSRVFGLFSGGNDSLTVTHFAANYLGSKLDGVVHINTGIGLPETRQFVGETCGRYDWSLMEYSAIACGQDYDELVVAHGFPGPDHHTKMFNRLKERPLRALLRDHPEGRVVLISGLRQQESGRRMRLRNEPIQRDGRRVWCAPFFNWKNDDVRAYRDEHQLVESPVRKILCMSGECLCGAYAKKGELNEIELWFPETGRRIRELEKRVAAAGFPWGWGEPPPAWWGRVKSAEKAGQKDAFQDEFDSEVQFLCTSCQFKHERAV